jgi:hypothetical protein
VSKAEQAWFLSRMERRAKPVSERDFLAGEIPRVFESLSLSFSEGEQGYPPKPFLITDLEMLTTPKEKILADILICYNFKQ